MLRISEKVSLAMSEIELSSIRAQGAGGQNVNKVSTAIHLRFDIMSSSLPELYKTRLMKKSDHRITKQGVVVIKSQRHRNREKNLEEALDRLVELIRSVMGTRKKRKATRPTRSSKIKRLDGKSKRGRVKALRSKVVD